MAGSVHVLMIEIAVFVKRRVLAGGREGRVRLPRPGQATDRRRERAHAHLRRAEPLQGHRHEGGAHAQGHGPPPELGHHVEKVSGAGGAGGGRHPLQQVNILKECTHVVRVLY